MLKGNLVHYQSSYFLFLIVLPVLNRLLDFRAFLTLPLTIEIIAEFDYTLLVVGSDARVAFQSGLFLLKLSAVPAMRITLKYWLSCISKSVMLYNVYYVSPECDLVTAFLDIF